MNKKATKFRETRGNGHPSQNNLPPIDKFHPDYWYYREEMDEPDDIDINYENESKNRNKKVIRLTESDIHRIVKESVKKVLNEIGDTEGGQNLLGRAKQRALYNREAGKEAEISNYAYNQRQKQPISQKEQLRNAYQQGFEDQWHKYHDK